MKNKIGFLIIFTVFLSNGFFLFSQENLIKNPSFEDTVNGKLAFWVEAGWKMDPSMTAYSLDNANPHSGKSSAKIVNMKENHTYYTQVIEVQENSIYKLSAWIKTDKVGKAVVGAAIGVINKLDIGGDIRETSPGWKPAELYIQTGSGITSFTVLLALGWYGATNTGTAWFDDASLVKTTSIPDGAVVCRLAQEIAKNEQPKQDNTTEPQNPKNQGAMIFFFILGGIVVLAGVLYIVLVMAKKKSKGTPVDEKKDENQPLDDNKQE